MGTPLLTQGEQESGTAIRKLPRHTPARAGRTVQVGINTRMEGAHPCSRRENQQASRIGASMNGTPLLAQGEPVAVAVGDLGLRHTPARAGRTSDATFCGNVRRAHLCSRRENRGRRGRRPLPGGTPLLAQGELHHAREGRLAPGHTPARAGRTRGAICAASRPSAHPCSRRENWACAGTVITWTGTPLLAQENMAKGLKPDAEAGTPLLAQGERTHGAGHEPPGRHTPARAGRTDTVCTR